MSILTERIYPALYERIEEALPEFQFKREPDKVISTTGIKITGEAGKAGKVYIYANNKGYLKDFTRGSISIFSYIQERDSLTNGETMKKLSELSGVKLKELTPEEIEEIKLRDRVANLWEDFNIFLRNSLDKGDKEPELMEVRKYIKERGYTRYKLTEKEIIPEDFGYISSHSTYKKYLKEKGYTEEEINSIKLHPAIGKTHRFTIGIRDSAGRIAGIGVRNIHYKESDKEGKYLYSSFKRGELLFNISDTDRKLNELLIVEGLLDPYKVKSYFKNVVSLGGSQISTGQVKQALKYGYSRFILCLDTDKAGQEGTLSSIDTLLKEGIKHIYVVEFPEGIPQQKTDPDNFITSPEKGEEFLGLVNTAKSYYKYWGDLIIKELGEAEGYTDSYKDRLRERVATYYTKIPNPADREDFLLYLNKDLEQAGVYKEVIEHKIKELSDIQGRLREEETIKKSISEAQRKLSSGDIKGAGETLAKGLKEAEAHSGESLREPYTFGTILTEIEETPSGLKTGFKELDKIASIPQGAITLIAGRPSHGKTTLMLNMLLNMVKDSEKKFYFFSYEEERKFLYLKLILSQIEGDYILHDIIDSLGYPAVNDYDALRYYIRNGRGTIGRIETAIKTLETFTRENRIEIIDKPYSVEELRTLINYLQKKEDIGAVFIDYIQRVRIKTKTQDKRVEIGTISDLIVNGIAKETGLPVILGAQLNRTSTSSGEPTLEHLKESGNLEEDANLVLSIYNKSREEEPPTGSKSWGDKVDIILKTLKNRNGEPNQKTTLSFHRYKYLITDPEI